MHFAVNLWNQLYNLSTLAMKAWHQEFSHLPKQEQIKQNASLQMQHIVPNHIKFFHLKWMQRDKRFVKEKHDAQFILQMHNQYCLQ